MPIYVYHCPACAAEFEILRPASQRDEATNCQVCGLGEARRCGASFASAVQGSSSSDRGASSACGGGGGFT